MDRNRDVIIIGAGIAGMAAAARLATSGYKVDIYEQLDYAGGKVGLLQKAGYTFDTGPSLFTQPYLLEQLFSSCNRQLSDYLSYSPLTTGTHYFYEDDTRLITSHQRGWLADELSQHLNTEAHNVFSFLDEMKKLYQYIGSIFLDKPVNKLSTWFHPSVLKALAHFKPVYLQRTMHEYHQERLKHPKLVQLFDRFATYNGSDPYKAPAMLCMIAHLELNEGIFYPHGGMYCIAQALYKLCEDAGVTFHFNSRVQQITHHKKSVTGIVCNQQHLPSKIVISNIDVYYTYKRLLQDNFQADKIKKQERSSSGLIFYWGIQNYLPQLGLHNVFFSHNYEEEFDALFNKHTFCNDPTVYINITSKMDKQHAPEGCENWFVLINTPATNSDTDPAVVQAVRSSVIKKINERLRTDIEPLIEAEQILTPSNIDLATGSYMGALYGSASNNKLAAFLRPGNVSRYYNGLFFAGGSVHPGGGVPLCLRSGKLASDAVREH